MQKKIIIISIIIVVLVVALAVWYFYFRTPSTPLAPATTPATEQTAQPNTPSSADNNALSVGDTTADIAKDLEQTFDEAAINNASVSLDQDLQTF